MKEEKKPYLCPTAVVYAMAVEGGLLNGSKVIPEGDAGNDNEGGGGAGTGGEQINLAPFGGFFDGDGASSRRGSGGDIWSDVEEY